MSRPRNRQGSMFNGCAAPIHHKEHSFNSWQNVNSLGIFVLHTFAFEILN